MRVEGIIGFLGCGNMGRAILKGLLDAGTIAPDQAIVCDVDPRRCDEARALDVAVAASPADCARAADTLMVAVKPQVMDAALDQVKDGITAGTLVVSIAAGISIAYIQARVGAAVRVVRVMPNTPAMVRAGASAFALSANCTPADAARVRAIFESVGIAEEVPESAMDAVTALSGSGPAYFFYLVECLVGAAVAQGLSEAQATRLAVQTLFGAGRLLKESGEPAGALRARVTSKGGTTEAALARFQADGLVRMVSAAVSAAAARSKELGQ